MFFFDDKFASQHLKAGQSNKLCGMFQSNLLFELLAPKTGIQVTRITNLNSMISLSSILIWDRLSDENLSGNHSQEYSTLDIDLMKAFLYEHKSLIKNRTLLVPSAYGTPKIPRFMLE